jgi:2-keto-3-deoxy-L-rhamnonate aldolase RhmA
MNFHNNVDRFRQRMLDGKICIGTSVQLTDPLVAEVAAEAGNDFVWIEMEHSHLNLPALLNHIIALRGTQAAAMVRVAWNDPVLIKPIVDMAPAAIVVPMIRSAEEALKAVQACQYPPKGVRGFGPMRNMYGIESMEEYLEVADEQILVFVQIEHIDAVDNLDAILATPGLDGIVLGRNDLSGSMGKLGQYSDPEVAEAIETVFAKACQTDLFVGVSVGYDLEVVGKWRPKGVHFFSLGGDLDYFFETAQAVADEVHGLD